MMPKFPALTCTNAYIAVNTLSGVLGALPAMVAPVAAYLPASFPLWLGVATAVVNLSIALYQKNVEAAAAVSLSPVSA